MKRCLLVLAVSLGVALSSAHAAPGDLDLTFAGAGKLAIGLGGATDVAQAVAIQNDGKTVVAGYTTRMAGTSQTRDFCVTRYNADGSRDNAFGTGGRVITQLNPLGSYAGAVKTQSDDKIVVAGTVIVSTSQVNTTDFAVVRYNPDGSLDSSFDGDGIVTTNVYGSSFDIGQSLLIQSDGKLIVSGDGVTLRYLTNGTLDPAFGGGDGIVFDPAPVGNGAVMQGNKIVLTGGVCSGVLIQTCNVATVRLNADGTPDTTFDGDGLAVTSVPSFTEYGNAVGIQQGNGTIQVPDKIVVVGNAGVDTLVVRYNNDGSLDTSFNGTGYLDLVIGTSSSTGTGVGFRLSVINGAADRIIVTGTADPGSQTSDFAIARLLTNGTFDTAFDGDGRARADFHTSNDTAYAVAFRSGLATVVGTADQDFALARFSVANGALDPTFDGDGKRIDDVGDIPATARAVALQADGKIVIAGDVFDFADYPAMARFNSDGSFDTTFNGSGKFLSINFPGDYRAVIVQPDGKILVAGNLAEASVGFSVSRYHSDGTPDATFNGDGDNDGTIFTAIGATEDTAFGMALQTDGKIVLAGRSLNGSTYNFAVARYNPNGALDITFNGTGKVTTPVGSGNAEGRALLIQNDGKIVVVGYASNGTNNDFALVRYNANGTLDMSFSGDGKQTTPILFGNDGANAVALDGDKLVVAGFANNGANNDFALARYNLNGALDTTFDTDGKLTTPIGAEDQAYAVRVQADGKIMVAGYSFTGASNDFVLVRYNNNGALDSTYGSGGVTAVDLSENAADYGFALALDPIGRAVVVGESNGIFGISRTLGDPFLRIQSIARLSASTIALQGLGVPGMLNTIQLSSAPNAGGFSSLGTVTPDVDGHWSLSDVSVTNVSTRFYRATFP